MFADRRASATAQYSVLTDVRAAKAHSTRAHDAGASLSTRFCGSFFSKKRASHSTGLAGRCGRRRRCQCCALRRWRRGRRGCAAAHLRYEQAHALQQQRHNRLVEVRANRQRRHVHRRRGGSGDRRLHLEKGRRRQAQPRAHTHARARTHELVGGAGSTRSGSGRAGGSRLHRAPAGRAEGATCGRALVPHTPITARAPLSQRPFSRRARWRRLASRPSTSTARRRTS
jgi:hypothetical protein